MKRGGILHPELAHLLASSGHTDFFTVSDAGFPVPPGPPRIDLALIADLPTVLDVVGAVHAEWTIERIVITAEMRDISSERVTALEMLLPGVRIETVSHLELKHLAAEAKATVRTGDTCPYANLILVSG